MNEQHILNASYFWDELLRISIILQRPVVQSQILVIAGSIFLSWLLAQRIWFEFEKKFPDISKFEEKNLKLLWQQYGAALLYYLLTPTLSLIGINLVKIWFVNQGWFIGYLNDGIKLLWIYGFYRLFLVSLYLTFPLKSVENYHYRFFAPLFGLFVVGLTINLFTDLSKLLHVSLINLFGELVTLGDIIITVAGLYFWIVGTSLAEKILLYLFESEVRKDPRLSQVVALIMRYFLIGLGIVLIFGYVGISPTALAAVTGGLSVGIGFGLKEVISNFVSGIWLIFEGALKPEDIISIDNEMSQVKRLGIRATTVQVIKDNSEKIIPNQTFFTQNFTTFTGTNTLVYRSVTVGTSYQCEPQKVIALLLQVADENTFVLKIPTPKAFAINFGDSSIDFELKFWIDDPLNGKSITSSLVCDIWQKFADNNIEIPYPQRDLHIRNDNAIMIEQIKPKNSC
ncbi:MAG TPA: mechanosensitive ion channel protein MscS [Cyanothece sp. UBA12306]|nr:mechanosensitive ion channel protein MscS [Cyanothece sp. UBA12306]